MNVAEDFFGDGEIKTGTQIARHFNSDMHFMHPIMDFLCEHGGLEKISQTIRLTPKGRQNVEEVAFIMPPVGSGV
jgi:predicted transcriptional regulator